MTELFTYIKEKRFDELYELIKKDETIDLDIMDETYNYFIHYVILYNNIEIMEYILKHRTIRLDILDTDGRNLLYIPIKYNYNDMLKLILDYDKLNIGMSIIDVSDMLGYTGLHYCVIFNNIKAFNILYRAGVDINVLDKKQNNIYMICLQYKRTELLIHILDTEVKKNHNINHFTNINGESVLMSAINYDDMKVVNYIINNKDFIKQIINIQEHEYGLTALHQAVVLGHNIIVVRMIENNANILLSDYLGNTPYHYAVIEKNYYVLDYLLKNNNNLTLINMNGNTPLHILLEDDIIDSTIIDSKKYQYDMYKILLKMIEYTDINVMNNDGNTIMHYIVMKNLWQLDEIKKILLTKNINVFITNKENKSIIDLVKTNIDEFKNMIVDCYYNMLKKNNNNLIEKWEQYCANDNITDLLKLFNRYNTGKNTIVNVCKEHIRKQIDEKIKSVPSMNDIALTIDSGIYMENCFYTGSTIDILFGLYYLYNNHKNIQLVLEYPLTQNKEIESYYMKMGLNYIFKMEFSNIEIVWSFMKLIYITNFDSIIINKINNGNRYIVIPLGIEVSTGSHANILIIDTMNMVIERFEPNGANPPRGFFYNPDMLDTLLETKFNNILPDYTFIKPSSYLPTIGFQILETMESDKCKNIGDPNGFCAVWCIWWAEMKATYNIDSKILAEKLINEIKLSNMSFKKIIRNFSHKIVMIRDDFLKRYNLTINDWINGNYNDDIHSLLENDILNNI
jgi:ankyrin repeat protein